MFSGIVETTAPVVGSEERAGVLQITLERPSAFDDLRPGDSVACDGVCLTLEKFEANSMQFALGPETLKVTGWSASGVLNRAMNLERSLRLGERIHGHLVTGHVDARAKVVEIQIEGETRTMSIEIPRRLEAYVWSKGSIAINGVSLTINHVGPRLFQVGLIPETVKRTNLGRLQAGMEVNLEADNLARGLVHLAELKAGK